MRLHRRFAPYTGRGGPIEAAGSTHLCVHGMGVLSWLQGRNLEDCEVAPGCAGAFMFLTWTVVLIQPRVLQGSGCGGAGGWFAESADTFLKDAGH